jgi:hypothetical protein
MQRNLRNLLAVVAYFGLLASYSWSQGTVPFRPKGTVIKYDQPIRHVMDPAVVPDDWPKNWEEDMLRWGENIWSDVDWNKIMMSGTLEPNWVIADDFRDPFKEPVRTVKWWGSYNPQPTVFQQTATGAVPVPPGPGVEDGYVISFFRDVPIGPPNPLPYSHPDGLLGTYVLPFDKVSIKETPYVGWDMHPIYEYEANLMDAHLDHALAPYADSMGFNQVAGEVYWISIMAEVGHALRLETIPGTDEVRWVSEDTGKFANDHYWGWHTSPKRFNDIATMGHLFMPGTQWEYFDWMPIQPHHYLLDMAFQLKTIPEPTTLGLILVAFMVNGFLVRCRRIYA